MTGFSGSLMVGVDLGLSGGVAVLNMQRKIVAVGNFERREDPVRSNVHSLLIEIREDNPEAMLFVAIETPPMVRPGGDTNAAAICGLWREWGLAIAAVDLLDARFTFAPPTTWQSRFWKKAERDALGLTTKQMARLKAEEFWPGFDWRLGNSSKDHDGVVDAALLALFSINMVFSEEFSNDEMGDSGTGGPG